MGYKSIMRTCEWVSEWVSRSLKKKFTTKTQFFCIYQRFLSVDLQGKSLIRYWVLFSWLWWTRVFFLILIPIGRIFLYISKGMKWLDPYFWVLIWLMNINCNALIKLFASYWYLSLTAFCFQLVIICFRCSMNYFSLVKIYFGSRSITSFLKMWPTPWLAGRRRYLDPWLPWRSSQQVQCIH